MAEDEDVVAARARGHAAEVAEVGAGLEGAGGDGVRPVARDGRDLIRADRSEVGGRERRALRGEERQERILIADALHRAAAEIAGARERAADGHVATREYLERRAEIFRRTAQDSRPRVCSSSRGV